jgi:dCMP deaminase
LLSGKDDKDMMMGRPGKDEYYLGIAEAVLARSTCIRRKYGAVIVKNDQIVSTGYNGSPRGEDNCCDTGFCQREKLGIAKGERYELCCAIHAEDNAIMNAGRDRTQGATLYIVGKNVADESYANPSPCMMCRRKIVNAGVDRVVGLFHDVDSDKIEARDIHFRS